MTKLAALALLLTFATSCDPIGPGPEVPECPKGTRPIVCNKVGVATCGEADSLEPVVGCRVEAEPGVWIECIASCS